jgi:hypothetical protein
LRINECTFRLCRGYAKSNINEKYHEASLDAHLVAEVDDGKRFSHITGWFIRYANIFKVFKEIAFLDTQAKLSEDEYN